MKLLKKLGIISIIFISICAVAARICEISSVNYISEEYTVKSGDTLWSIAGEYADENQSLREYIYEIKKVNNMTSNNLEVGQNITIYK